MALLLGTPEQHDFQDPTLELDERRLQSWLAGLPVLNPRESLRLVVNALEPLNEQRLAFDKRLRLLRLYLITARRLYVAAEPLRLRRQPLSRQQRQDTIDHVERLCQALANGFKIVVKELYAAGVQAGDKARFGTVLNWAVQQLAAALLHSYRYYRPEPPQVFLELNQLYRLARHHGVHNHKEPDEYGEVQADLAGIYQAICLMSLADPFSLEEGQADRYYIGLLQYAADIRIVPGNSWHDMPEGLYFIDLLSDGRPRHCVLLQSPAAGDDPHLIDARTALQQMQNALAALPADRRSQRVETALLKGLLPEVTPRDKRRSERRPDGRWIEVVLGLQPVCAWVHARQRGEQVATTRWTVKDVSEQGYRLAWEESAASLLQVGDLICVVDDSTDEQQQCQLLLVRWVCDEREKGTQLGVEKLSGVPNPVRVAIPCEDDAQVYQALFLPSNGGTAAMARLLVPSQVYEQNRALLVYVGDREIAIRCGARVAQGAEFDCFEFLAGG